MGTPGADSLAAIRGAGLLSLLQIANRFLGFGFVVLASRLITPSEFGRYSIVASIAVFAGFLADFGTTSAATKVVSGGTSPGDLIADAFGLSAMLGIGGWVVGLLALRLIGFPGGVLVDFSIYGSALPFDACLTTVVGAFNGDGRLTIGAWLGSLRLASGVMGGAVALVASHSIRGAFVGMAVAAPSTLVLAVALAIRTGTWSGRISVNIRSAQFLATAIPFALISGLGIVASKFDVTLISILYSRSETAAYDVALRASSTPIAMVGILEGPSLYLFSRRLKSGGKDSVSNGFGQLARMFFLVGMPISVGGAVLGRPLILAVFGARYASAAVPFSILAGQTVLMFVTGIQGLLLAALPKMRRVVLLIGALNILGIALQAAFIVQGGIVGAALAIPICQLFAIVAQGLFLERRIGFLAIPVPSLKLIAATVACGAAAYSMRDHLFLGLGAGAAAYGATVLITGEIGRDDVALLRLMRPRRGATLE